MKLEAVDLFCGAGGTSAGAEATGEVRLVAAVNHWSRAIETHQANFPDARHYHSAIDQIDPRDCPKVNTLFASPECTHFGWARGTRKRSATSRCLAFSLLPWFETHRPQWAVIENITEFADWGPIKPNGKPIQSGIGRVFDAWLMAIRAYGYSVDYRILNAADYGAATSRERLFVIARRGRKSPVWPVVTHPIHCPFLSVLDEQLPLTAVSDRDKPLCPNTLAALERGQKIFGPSRWIYGYYGSATFTGLARPLPTITTHDRFALHDATGADFKTRMLANHELAAAQGFPLDYVFCGTKTEITRQIGNSVSPKVAQAITQAILSV